MAWTPLTHDRPRHLVKGHVENTRPARPELSRRSHSERQRLGPHAPISHIREEAALDWTCPDFLLSAQQFGCISMSIIHHYDNIGFNFNLKYKNNVWL